MRALSEHNPDISLHSERVPEEYQFPENIAKVVVAWDHLPETVKAGILAMVETAQ